MPELVLFFEDAIRNEVFPRMKYCSAVMIGFGEVVEISTNLGTTFCTGRSVVGSGSVEVNENGKTNANKIAHLTRNDVFWLIVSMHGTQTQL